MTLALRPEVAAFAQLMEAKLRANDHKTGWKTMPPALVVFRIDEEMAELKRALDRNLGGRRLEGDVGRPSRGAGFFWPDAAREVAGEGADVANMIMMLLDVVGSLDDVDAADLVASQRRR